MLVNQISRGLTLLGRRIANQLRNIPGLGGLVPNRATNSTAIGNSNSGVTRGAENLFQRKVLAYLNSIVKCVCGQGFGRGGGGIDPEIQARRDRTRAGRGPTGPGRIPGPDRSAILPGTQYRRPIGPAMPVGSRGFPMEGPLVLQRQRGPRFGSRALEFGRDLLGTGANEAFPGYIDRSGTGTAARFNRRYGSGGTRAVLGRRIKGAMPDLGGFSEKGLGLGRELTYTGAEKALSGRISLSEQNAAARFNRRYGSGGTRAVLGRRIRGFGKGALIAGGIAGGMALLNAGSAQASEFDPETGEPIMTSGQRQAAGVGNVLSGGLEGAMLGATIGSIIPGVGTAVGAVIGGVIGGVVPLRKGVTEFTTGIGKSFQRAGRNISDAAGQGVQWFKDGLSSINKWFSNIDWKNVLINALIPGGPMTIQGLQGIANFASKLNIFEGIKSGIDSVKGVVEAIRDNLPSWLGGRRALGGPVTRGVPFLVGENGPELFVPSGDGSVVSNLALNQSSRAGASSSSSVSANFNVTINVNGGLGSPGAVEELRAPIIAIINEAWADATAGTVTRGSIV